MGFPASAQPDEPDKSPKIRLTPDEALRKVHMEGYALIAKAITDGFHEVAEAIRENRGDGRQ